MLGKYSTFELLFESTDEVWEDLNKTQLTAYSKEWSQCVGKYWVIESERYKLGGKKDDGLDQGSCGQIWQLVWIRLPLNGYRDKQEKERGLKDTIVLWE